MRKKPCNKKFNLQKSLRRYAVGLDFSEMLHATNRFVFIDAMQVAHQRGFRGDSGRLGVRHGKKRQPPAE